MDDEKKIEPVKSDVEDLQKAIELLLSELEYHDPDSDEAKKICDNVKTLCDAKASIEKAKPNNKLCMNTVVEVLGSLLGVVAIGSLESAKILPQKGFTLLMKMFKK